MMLTKEKKRNVIENYKIHSTDTGSSAVQIAILTEKINYLSEHFDKNPKDHGSRRGFLKLIGQRRKLLNYLKRYDKDSYQKLTAKLEFKKKGKDKKDNLK